MTTRSTSPEAGFSMVVAVILMSLIAVVIGVLMQVSDSERRESSRTLARSEQIGIADSAVSRYLVALNTGYAGRRTNFQLVEGAFRNASSPLRRYVLRGEVRVFPYGPGATTFANNAPGRDCIQPLNTVPTPPVTRREGAVGAPWPVDDAVVGQTRFIVEEDHPGRPCAYWEVFRVDPLPLANMDIGLSAHRHIGIIFRVWTGSATNPRYVRTTVSRGYFSDYQLLTDDEIRFGSNVTITGKVHSNNYGEEGIAISGPSSLRCYGNDAKVTARSGAISFAGGSRPECRAASPTGKAIDLGAIEYAVRDVDSACASDPSRYRFACFGPLGGAGYRVEVGSPIRVTVATTGALVATIWPGARPYTLRFNEDRVYVRDGSSPIRGSVTVFAHSDDVSHIYVEGSSFGPPVGSRPVVGLLSQGDIVINSVNPAGAGGCGGGRNVTINAAMMAETGTLTVPHKWLSQIRQRATPRCGNLTVNGAIATRSAPVLQMRWNGVDYGFSSRSLNWNSMLKRVVPPMYPATGPWEMATWREANHDCLRTTMPIPGDCAL